MSMLSIIGAVSNAQQKASQVSGRIDEYMGALVKTGSFNGNLFVSKDGRMLTQKSFNLANAPAAMQLHENDPVMAPSLSKVFVKVAIGRLAETGKLKFNDPIAAYFSGFNPAITVQQLLDHRSGLPRELSTMPLDREYPLDSVVLAAAGEKLLFTPGKEVRYSALGYAVLQKLIDNIAPGGYRQFIRTEVITRLNLTATHEFTSPAQTRASFVPGANGPTAVTSFPYREIYNLEYVTTLSDFSSLANRIFDGQALSQNTAMKLFWRDSVLSQAGGREGYRTFFYKNIKTGVSFGFLCNYSDLPFQDVCDDIIKIVQGQPYRLKEKHLRVAKELPDEKLKLYVGKYLLEPDRNQVFEISLENGKLVFNDGVERILLTAETDDTFFEKPDSRDSFIFEEDEKTKKYNLLLIAGGVRFRALRSD